MFILCHTLQRQDSNELEHKNQQLTRENDELRSLCSFLDQTAKRNLQLAAEWQSFGKYTASVLKNEMETHETKMKLLEEQLKRLSTENKELREMCLYLNRSQEDSNVQLTPPESTELLIHTHILAELNKRGGGIIPQYRGLTSENTLKDERNNRGSAKEQLVPRGVEPKVAMAEMKKRVDQLEREKLELVKVSTEYNNYSYTAVLHSFSLHTQSLSAAHLLAANTPKLEDKPSSYMAPSQKTTAAQPLVDTPPDLASFLKQGDSQSKPSAHLASQETIMTAVTVSEHHNLMC